jgi:hypothetical protein
VLTAILLVDWRIFVKELLQPNSIAMAENMAPEFVQKILKNVLTPIK